MLKDAVNLFELLSHQVTFASCLAIFLGGGYIALHSRVMPRWAVTGLWYVGLAALLNAITILVEWSTDQLHPLSHFQIGQAVNTLFMLSIAAMVVMLFFNTVWKDYQGSRERITSGFDKLRRAKSGVKGKVKQASKKTVNRVRNVNRKKPGGLEL